MIAQKKIQDETCAHKLEKVTRYEWFIEEMMARVTIQ